MTLRDIVLIAFASNLLFGFTGIALIGFSLLTLYSLAINLGTVLLAYWIREDGAEIQCLREQVTKMIREKELETYARG